MEQYLVDNFKNKYSAGSKSVAISTSYSMMFLATNPEWQDRVRAEVLEAMGGQKLEPSMLRKMKTVSNGIFVCVCVCVYIYICIYISFHRNKIK